MRHISCRWAGPAVTLSLGLNILWAADNVRCQAEIKVRQQIVAAASGWSALLDDMPHLLAGITFYEGKPEDKASLAPDTERKSGNKVVSTWLFSGGPQSTWVACRYAWTSVLLTRELPKSIHTCSATYNSRENVGGLPAIEKIDCK